MLPLLLVLTQAPIELRSGMIDAWDPHESRVDEAPIAAGLHALRVEYYQNDGWGRVAGRGCEGAPVMRVRNRRRAAEVDS